MEYEVSKMPILGQGAFGTVYKADARTALKVVNVGTDANLKHFALSEIEFMFKVNRLVYLTFYICHFCNKSDNLQRYNILHFIQSKFVW